MRRHTAAALAAATLVGCSDTTSPPTQTTFEFDFAQQAHGWEAGFADYPVGDEQNVQPESEYDQLPAELGGEDAGLFIAGTNTPDDLFMFWKRRVTGLAPNTAYEVTFVIDFATAAPSGCSGIGGSPGGSVFMKAGATVVEPVPVVEDVGGIGYYRLNIDKGDQGQGGGAAVVLGDVGNTNTDCMNPEWQLKRLSQDAALTVTTASDGSAWLIVGTDSGFEGRTELYYTMIRAVFERT